MLWCSVTLFKYRKKSSISRRMKRERVWFGVRWLMGFFSGMPNLLAFHWWVFFKQEKSLFLQDLAEARYCPLYSRQPAQRRLQPHSWPSSLSLDKSACCSIKETKLHGPSPWKGQMRTADPLPSLTVAVSSQPGSSLPLIGRTRTYDQASGLWILAGLNDLVG